MNRLSGFAVMVCCAAALSFGTASIAFAETESAGAQVQQLTDTVNTDAAAAETAEMALDSTQADVEEAAQENMQEEVSESAQETAAENVEEAAAENAENDTEEEAAENVQDAGLPELTGDTAEQAETAPEQDPVVTQELRQEVVDYALSFVGGRYVWGGEDPHSGADCSGFVRYILSNTAGVSMSRSSYDQAREGETVSPEEMQPGDLLFYGNGRRVNHVAMYIGNGQIVHASTAKTGIKVSQWNYRTPVRIASFIG